MGYTIEEPKYTIEEPEKTSKYTIEEPEEISKYTIEEPTEQEEGTGLLEKGKNIIDKYTSFGYAKPVLKAMTTPVSKTLGFKSPSEMVEPTAAQLAFEGSPVKSFLAGLGGDVADIGTTPATYIPIPAGKALGKIPIKGTTLGQIAKRVPLGKGFKGGIKELARLDKTLKPFAKQFQSRNAPINAVQRLMDAIEDAGPVRQEQDVLISAERQRQVAILRRIGEKVQGEAGARAKLGAVKGPMAKAGWRGIKNKIKQEDIDTLYQMINNSNRISEHEKLAAINGLDRILGEVGTVPTPSQLELLREIYPQQLIKTLLNKRPFLRKMGETVAEVLNVPRAMMATGELSAPLRQGLFFIGRPKQWLPSFRDMFKYAFSEKAYQGLLKDIKNRPTYRLMRKAKIAITELGGKLGSREEAIISQLPEKIPLFGKVVRGSNRAYSGFLTKLRADVFDDIVKTHTKLGGKIDRKFLHGLGDMVNVFTGRGKLSSGLERVAPQLNAMLFSPRLLSSRMALLNPVFYAKLPPTVRKEALKSLLTFAGLTSSVLMLAKVGGADVETDPRSSDFAKIKVGKTRYDILGGLQQYLRLAAQLFTGQRKSSTTGVVTNVGEGYKPLTRAGMIGNFIESKEAPTLSYGVGLLRGQTNFGKEFLPGKEAGLRMIPMMYQDAYDLAVDRGPESLAMSLPAVFGTGMQTYNMEPSDIVRSANAAEKYAKQLFKQGRKEEAMEIMEENKELRRLASKLSIYDDIFKERKKRREEVRKRAKISPQKRANRILKIEEDMEKIERKMKEILQQERLLSRFPRSN